MFLGININGQTWIGNMITKPMLAGTVDDISTLHYPLFASPKIDGIRVLTLYQNIVKSHSMDQGGINAYTYSRINEEFKLLKNLQMRSMLKTLPAGLDGELLTLDNAGAPNTFNDCQSKVMSKSVTSAFQYLIFDYLPNQQTHVPFLQRMELLSKLELPFFCSLLPQTYVKDADELELYESQIVEAGYEGVMLKAIDAPYKQGRSTLREGYLLKLKRFEDAEAELIGAEELVREHHNESTGMLGALQCRYNDVLFSIGTGFTEQQRKMFWLARHKLPKHVTFKYQKYGTKDAPRSPVFKAFVLE